MKHNKAKHDKMRYAYNQCSKLCLALKAKISVLKGFLCHRHVYYTSAGVVVVFTSFRC